VVRAIGAMVAAALGLSASDITSDRRGAAEIAFARQVAMYLAHTHLRMPLTEAGRLFHRDRTTVRHACRQVEDRRDDPEVDRLLSCLERGIELAADIAQLRVERGSHA
jgi:chromosomal replication initiation ATPase DnaA